MERIGQKVSDAPPWVEVFSHFWLFIRHSDTGYDKLLLLRNCSSVLKSDAKQRLAHNQRLVDSAAVAREHEMGLMEWRAHCLTREVSLSMAAITPEVVSAAYRNADSYLIRCLNSEEILH